jgi:hypothetical protein
VENCEDVFSAFKELFLNCQDDSSQLKGDLLKALKSASIVSLFSQTGIAEILPSDENFLRIVKLVVIVDRNDLSKPMIIKVMMFIPERLTDLFAQRFKCCRNLWPFLSHLRRRARMCDAFLAPCGHQWRRPLHKPAPYEKKPFQVGATCLSD